MESYLPRLKASAWAGTRLRDIADMASGMEGSETGNDAYRNPAHKQFQLEATLGWQHANGGSICRLAVRAGRPARFPRDRLKAAAQTRVKTWAYTSSNTAVLAEVMERTTGKSLARCDQRINLEPDGRGATMRCCCKMSGDIRSRMRGMVTTLRDLARFGLLFTKSAGPNAARDHSGENTAPDAAGRAAG